MDDHEGKAQQIYEASEAQRCRLQQGAHYVPWAMAPLEVKDKYRDVASKIPLEQALLFIRNRVN